MRSDQLLGILIVILVVIAIVSVIRWILQEDDRQWQMRRREWQLEERERLFANLRMDGVDSLDGGSFEEYVARLMRHQGYAVSVTKHSGDFGVDLIAANVSQKYAIQVKRQSKPVSRRAVSDAVAGKVHYRCTGAMVVTNSIFTSGAVKLARSTGCRLVDRDELAKWVNASRQ